MAKYPSITELGKRELARRQRLDKQKRQDRKLAKILATALLAELQNPTDPGWDKPIEKFEERGQFWPRRKKCYGICVTNTGKVIRFNGNMPWGDEADEYNQNPGPAIVIEWLDEWDNASIWTHEGAAVNKAIRLALTEIVKPKLLPVGRDITFTPVDCRSVTSLRIRGTKVP